MSARTNDAEAPMRSIRLSSQTPSTSPYIQRPKFTSAIRGGYAVDGLYLVTVAALGHTETKTLAVVK